MSVRDNEPLPEKPMPELPAHWRSLPEAFVRQARMHPSAKAVVDSSGVHLNYGELFLRAAALAKVLARELGDCRYVGILLPPSVAAVVANVAISLLGKVVVNLNYAAGQQPVDSAIRQCEITHVVTAHKALARLEIRPDAHLIELEPLMARISLWDKLWAWAVVRLVPTDLLHNVLPGLRPDRLDETAAILFTSGATGDPKGVILSHRNILSNIRQTEAQLEPSPEEVVLGVLPFFHAMGFTVTLWAVLCLGRRAVYHVNPLDAHVVGRLCHEHGVTLIFATPTFMRVYLKRCEPIQLATLRRVGLGAEKLKPELAQEFRQRLGFDALEGYGMTELSPIVSFNVDREIEAPDGRRIAGNRPGTVGQPVAGTAIKCIHPESRVDLPKGVEGIVCVRGPQVMVGYLNRPESTAQVLKEGWFITDDMGRLDDDGFLCLSGRVSRFSKIGGEMVSHERIEAELRVAVPVDNEAVAVTAVPDPKRGERLVVLYTNLGGKTPDEVREALIMQGLPKLWIPAVGDFLQVEALPVLGSGKVDLHRLRVLAQEGIRP